MTISMDPHVFGSLFTWVSLFTLAGIGLAVGLLLRQGTALDPLASANRDSSRTWLSAGRSADAGRPAQLKGLGASRGAVYAVAVRAVLWGLVGARVLHVADYWGFYSGVPLEVFYLWNGGLALWGGVLGATAGGLWHAHRRGMPLGRLADVTAVAGLSGMALGRLGDLLAGERPATPTSLPWGIEYAHPDSAAYVAGGAVHPAALYEMLLDIAVIGVLWRLGARREAGRLVPEGATFVLAIALYATGRFFIGFVRVDPTLLGLQQAQWVALAVLAGAAAYAWRLRKGRLREAR